MLWSKHITAYKEKILCIFDQGDLPIYESWGVAWFYVDLRDMIGGKKNHLRFAADVWEDHTHYNMDNYTNRLSYSEMRDIFCPKGLRSKRQR